MAADRQEEPANDDGNNTPALCINKDLSKNAQKRLLKRERFMATRAEWKAKMKAKKNLRKERAKNIEDPARKGELQNDPIAQETSMIEKPHTEEPQGTIIIDMSFEALMNDKEINSLVAQICRCYSVNRRSTRPFNIWVMGLSNKTATELSRAFPDYLCWKVRFDTTSLEDHMKNDPRPAELNRAVYLSADAEQTLDYVNSESVYVIGGLVDRNRHKNVAVRRAADLGLSTAKLPLEGNVRLKGSRVLTVFHVFQILCKQRESGSWPEAISTAIPNRKQAN